MRCLVIILFSIFSLSAQNFKIEGQITSDGENLPYANIIIRSIRKGVIADIEGKYSLKNILTKILEFDTCQKFKIEPKFGVGGNHKESSSSDLLKRWEVHLNKQTKD